MGPSPINEACDASRLGQAATRRWSEVGDSPFEPEAAAQFYALVASRYERASLSVSSNDPSATGPRSSATRPLRC